MTLLPILIVASIAAGSPALSAAGQPASTAAPEQAQAVPAAHQLVANVRQAVGYRHLRSFGRAFAIVERGPDGKTNELHFGVRQGQLRRGSDYWFDGFQGWQIDERRNIRVPASLRQHEKAAWPLWVRGYWWLNPGSGFAARILADESNGREIAVALSMPDGIVGATVYVDRTTWLPSRLVVPYERGPFTERYDDYRDVRGVRFPFGVESNYRGTSRRQLVSVAPLDSLASFERPPLPADHRFAATVPAALVAREGAPFPSGTPGHVYVRGSADGRDGWWHFDSGSDSMIIDESVAKALGMEIVGTHRSMGADGNVREGTWRRGKSFVLGRIRIENPVFRALDLSENNAPPGERRMGTIGYDLFARSVVEYGAGGKTVRICNPATYGLPRGARWQRLEHIDSTPASRGLAEGIPGLFQLDTGAAGSIDFTRQFHERNAMLRSRDSRRMNSLGSGGGFAVQVGQLKEFRIGGEVFRDLEAVFRTGGISREGSAGTVGREVLNHFTMVFDYPHQRLAFVAAGRSGRCD